MDILDNLKKINGRISHLKERHEAVETRLGPHSPNLTEDKVKTTPSDKATMLLAVLADISVEIDRLEEEKESLASDLMELVKKADLTPDETIVMRLRYIYGAKWYDVADAMYLSPRYVYKLHGEALYKLRKVNNR